MPRSKGPGRGTRLSQKGILSGSTIATVPSGVTLAEAGILYDGTTEVSPTELGYLDGVGGAILAAPAAGGLAAGGITNWGGSSVLIDTGLSTVVAFTGSFYREPNSAVTIPISVEWVQHNKTASDGIVTAALMYHANIDAPVGASPATKVASGGSLAWIAFGT